MLTKTMNCEKKNDKGCRVIPTRFVATFNINDLRSLMKGFIRMFRLAEIGRRLSPISESGQMIYWHLLENADWRTGRIITTHEELAAQQGKSVRTIERSTRELVNSGLVRHRKGVFAINPEFAWGGRSWNIPKAAYHSMGQKTGQVISFADAAQALSEEAAERAGLETLREISARKRK